MFTNNFIIGNTPIIKINYQYNNKVKSIYAKLEYYNLTGSIKDRVAYYIINNAKKKGILKDNQAIIEATSGNTGISLAALGAYYHHPVYIFMPNWVSKERISLIKSYGAKVFLISKEDGGFIECTKKAKNLAIENNGFLANQFASYDNFLAHYETTGAEILEQLPKKIGGLVSGIGTGGTLLGISAKLKEKYPKMITCAIEPTNAPLLSTGKIIKSHKIEGIGDDFIPDLVDKEKIDKIILIDDDDAINMARKLAKELGLGIGISSGANFLGSILLHEEINDDIVTVFADDNKKYLTTTLANDIDDNPQFISNKIKLLNYEII